MTLQQFQQYLHSLYQGDTSTPSDGDEDWNYRETLLIWAVGEWDNEDGIFWNELFKLNSDAQTQTGDGSTTTFSAPSDFRFPCSWVVLINGTQRERYNVRKASEIEMSQGNADKVVYFTGNKSDGFTLNFITAPASGWTVEYPYYKEPTAPSDAADIIEMADPWFAIHVCLSKLHENDGEGDRATLALQTAIKHMKNMRIRNELPAYLQMDDIPDTMFRQGVKGFGQ